MRDRVLRLLVEQVEDHREVVHTERPQRVLVRPHDAEVLPVAVHAQHLAELPRVDQLLQLQHRGVVQEEMARHQHEVSRLGECDELVHLRGARCRRLLDQDVLTGIERTLRELVVRRHRGRDHDRVDGVVREHLFDVACDVRIRITRLCLFAALRARVDEPCELCELVEVAREIRAPVAEAGEADADGRGRRHAPRASRPCRRPLRPSSRCGSRRSRCPGGPRPRSRSTSGR